MILTPEGKILEYYYGVEFAPKDLRLGLIQASQNKIGTARRRSAAVLLSLRSAHRQVRGDDSHPLKLAGIATLLGLRMLMSVLVRLGSGPRGRAAR